ncbi:FAD-dependent oxidoreductase [Kribbella sp. NBC_01245]|uniref:FAD-dependent oxidoreductase n=1 Tax=Kribbella sp. NBC_01245 TaxID=2903578 RepID=UPI002E291F8A|nr:FAD-dependent oxidoreductase [Kribbella sp. NBC_01245]
MAFAITQTCCSDATCVSVCPVNCIHPTPDDPDFGKTEMLYVDPQTCIDCGACADACPVDAIFPVDELPAAQASYAGLNASYYADKPLAPVVAGPTFHAWGPPSFHRSLPADFAPLRVAVVGTGPAGMYAAEDLLLNTNAQVTFVDRLPLAGGLIRYGVAPDHLSTKKIGETFERLYRHPRARLRLGAEVGHGELAASYDAVIYAVGATDDRRLGIPGEDLPGSVGAGAVVAWYNDHPEAVRIACDSERVVVVGTGNVALDIARILLSDPAALAATGMPSDVLASLGKVREVVLLGRRGPAEAAYTGSEFLAMRSLPGVEVVVDSAGCAPDPGVGQTGLLAGMRANDPDVGQTGLLAGVRANDSGGGKAGLLAGVKVEKVDWARPPGVGRRLVLRFGSVPSRVLGSAAVRGLALADGTEIPAGLVVRAIGFRGRPIPGLPFDETTGTVPHSAGRVDGVPFTYVVGWIKRGPSGGIGTNRPCARETVSTLLADTLATRRPHQPTPPSPIRKSRPL